MRVTLHGRCRRRGRSERLLRGGCGCDGGVSRREGRGRTPLMRPARDGAGALVLRSLVAALADLEARDGDGRTALCIAVVINWLTHPVFRRHSCDKATASLPTAPQDSQGGRGPRARPAHPAQEIWRCQARSARRVRRGWQSRWLRRARYTKALWLTWGFCTTAVLNFSSVMYT